MKSFVAFLLVLSILSAGAVAQKPTASRGPSQSAASKPRGDTIKLCQGLPVPDGYVIIAYMTSTACPHGAYLLKKQNDYEGSLSVNRTGREPAASDDSADTSRSSKPTTAGTATGRNARGSSQPPRSSSRANRDSGAAASTAAVSRPRRVGNAADSSTTPDN